MERYLRPGNLMMYRNAIVSELHGSPGENMLGKAEERTVSVTAHPARSFVTGAALAGCAALAPGSHLGAQSVQQSELVEEALTLWSEADVVALGEHHGSQLDSDFRMALVRHPDFASTVDLIVVEFANAHFQDLLDRYVVAGAEGPRSELVRIWRETGFQTWDSPVYEAFLTAVREVNAKLPEEDRVRVIAGDPPKDWHGMSSGRELLRTMDRGDFPTHIVDCRILTRGVKAFLVYGAGHVVHGRGDSFIYALDQKYPGRIRTIVSVQGDALEALRTTLSDPDEPRLLSVEETTISDMGLSEALEMHRVGPPVKLSEGVDGILYYGDATDEVVRRDPRVDEEPEYQGLRQRMAELREEARAIIDREGFEGVWQYDDYTCNQDGSARFPGRGRS